ncbi:MAG: MptD family putative ECF transporter S component [Thainema sp.]
MKSPWSLRDYVFAAFMTIGMIASAFIVGPFVPPFLDLVVWAPFGGIFMTLGMARLQRRGSVALMILPLALVLAPLSPIIFVYLVLTTLVTEAVVFFQGNYRPKANRLLGTVVFFVSAVLIGLGSILMLASRASAGAATSGGLSEMLSRFATLINNPWLIGILAVATGLLGAVGWWMGERIVQQLRRAGKLDAE